MKSSCPMKPFYSSYINSPLGAMIAVSSDNGICFLGFLDKVSLPDLYRRYEQISGLAIKKEANIHLESLAKELDRYFHDKLKTFETSIDLIGTEFQKSVWKVLMQVGYGETQSYKSLAEDDLLNSSSRAVANANSKNPVSILIPCHRIIGSDGSLAGYSGGLDRKKKLLQMELKNTPQLYSLF